MRLESGGVRLAQEDRIRTACSACPDVEPSQMGNRTRTSCTSDWDSDPAPVGGWDLGAARALLSANWLDSFHLYEEGPTVR